MSFGAAARATICLGDPETIVWMEAAEATSWTGVAGPTPFTEDLASICCGMGIAAARPDRWARKPT